MRQSKTIAALLMLVSCLVSSLILVPKVVRMKIGGGGLISKIWPCRWAFTVHKIINFSDCTTCLVLSEPNNKSPLNAQAADQWKNQKCESLNFYGYHNVILFHVYLALTVMVKIIPYESYCLAGKYLSLN